MSTNPAPKRPVFVPKLFTTFAEGYRLPDLRADTLGLGSALPRAVPSDAVVAVLDDVVPAVLLQKLVPPGAPFLQKPFTPEALARTVAELLALPRRTG